MDQSLIFEKFQVAKFLACLSDANNFKALSNYLLLRLQGFPMAT